MSDLQGIGRDEFRDFRDEFRQSRSETNDVLREIRTHLMTLNSRTAKAETAIAVLHERGSALVERVKTRTEKATPWAAFSGFAIAFVEVVRHFWAGK